MQCEERQLTVTKLEGMPAVLASIVPRDNEAKSRSPQKKSKSKDKSQEQDQGNKIILEQNPQTMGQEQDTEMKQSSKAPKKRMFVSFNQLTPSG